MTPHTTHGRARRIRRALAVTALIALAAGCGAEASEAPTPGAQATPPSSSSETTPATQEAGSPQESATGSESTGSESTGQETAVAVMNFAFKPPTVTVKAGSTVVWTNKDSFAHTVTAGKRGAQKDTFDGQLGELNTNDNAGEMFTYTFEEKGSYPYFCRFHPNMQGTVEVQ